MPCTSLQVCSSRSHLFLISKWTILLSLTHSHSFILLHRYYFCDRDLREHLRRLQQQSDSRRRAAVMEMMRQRAAEVASGGAVWWSHFLYIYCYYLCVTLFVLVRNFFQSDLISMEKVKIIWCCFWWWLDMLIEIETRWWTAGGGTEREKVQWTIISLGRAAVFVLFNVSSTKAKSSTWESS